MKKIVKKRQLFNKKLVLNIILVLFMFLSIGYSTLSTNLNINGNLNVKKYYEHTLYNVLAKEAETGGLAKKYTGEHHDSFTEEPSKDIYHWYAANDSQGTQVLDKNNVIFADHCWQMFRTTDTGGVKMIYNGEVENNQCLNTRGTHVGYGSATSQNMDTTYYYGTSCNYDEVNNTFSLDGVITTGTIQIGQYTCKQTTSDGACATLYLVDSLKNGSSYYVIPLNADSHFSHFGSLQYNLNKYVSNSPSYLGYMYNSFYPYNNTSLLYDYVQVSIQLSTSYYYADSYDYNSTNPNKYTLTNPYQISSTDDYSSLVGKYTFRNNSSSYSNNRIIYITSINANDAHGIELFDGNNLEYYNYSYTYGDSYTDNGNGTYTINNPTTIRRINYTSNYNNMKGKYICKNAVNNTCSELWHAANNTEGRYLYYNSSAESYIFSSGFEYDENTNKYVLSDDRVELWDTLESSFISNVNNHHYTCFSSSDECSAISYVYYFSNRMDYINIENGEDIDDAINNMLYNDGVNTINSTIKTAIDAWYEKYLIDYSNYLEDTIYCNNRVQSNSNTNGWNANGGSISTHMFFYDSNSLFCQNGTDSFSTLNNKAKLKYKVGLVGTAEYSALGNSNIRKTGQGYWTMSSGVFYYSNACIITVNASGGFYSYGNVSGQKNGLRPVVSLLPGTKYIDGDGSMANPYIVEVN